MLLTTTALLLLCISQPVRSIEFSHAFGTGCIAAEGPIRELFSSPRGKFVAARVGNGVDVFALDAATDQLTQVWHVGPKSTPGAASVLSVDDEGRLTFFE